MKTIKGPAIFLGQFAGDAAPFNSWDAITKWAADKGYAGVQVPTWAAQLIDLKKASESKDYCDEFAGVARQNGIEVTELSTHLQGQLVAVHPAYDEAFDGFAAPEVRGNPKARQEWAVEQVKMALKASRHLGIKAHATFSGALAWPFIYPWPQRPAGLVETAFDELARRWRPILDFADEQGVDVCYEIHPGEDLHDGVTFEMFLERVGNHARANMLYDPSHYVLQCLDYLDNIDIYKDRIKMFHVKDAEFNPTGRQGVYGGYQGWVGRAGRFRSLGDGQVDFGAVFSKLTANDFDGWAVVEWECALKNSEDGAREGAEFVKAHIIRVTDKAFDDFASGGTDEAANRRMLGLSVEPAVRTGAMALEVSTSQKSEAVGSVSSELPVSIPAAPKQQRINKIRLGMVGGGQGAFIGAVHRMAARLDDHYDLVAGALSSTPEKSRASGEDLGLDAERCYGSFEEMAEREAARPDGIEAVSIVTPNHVHFAAAKAFLERGIHVICDKPLTSNLSDALKLKQVADKSNALFILTHNYTGYPMVRQARELVRSGELGDIRLVQMEYPQDWLAEPVEQTGAKQAVWRTDPAQSGIGGSTGDIGTHAYNLGSFISGLELDELAADVHTFVEGRRLDDNAHVMMRFKAKTPDMPAKGLLWCSQVATGNENGLRVRVYGTKAGIEWAQADPNYLWFTKLGEPKQLMTRGGAGAGTAASRVTRIPSGHPEGYLEAFATIYSEAALAIKAARSGAAVDPAVVYPTVDDGVKGVAFITACIESSKKNGDWVKVLPPLVSFQF